jgi:S-layer protein
LGAGDDTYALAAYSSGTTVTAALDGGDGEDTMSMSAAAAAALDGNSVFRDDLTSFEILEISGSSLTSTTLNLENLGFDSITTSGTGKVAVTDGGTIAAADKLKLTVNNVEVTTGALHANTVNNTNVTTALNTAINSALSTSGVTYVAAVVSTASNASDTITVTAANDGVSLSNISHIDVGTGNAETAGTNTALVIDKIASGGTVKITKNGELTVQVKDASTGTADTINLTTDADGNLPMGKVTVANVETVNLSAVDKFKDVTGEKDEFGANIADGKDDTNSVQSVTLDIDEATTLNITGSADLTVDLVDTNNSGADIKTATVDASSFTGKLTLVADGITTGTTVKSGSGDDTITADGSNDVLIGGAGDDTLTGTTLTTLTGGDGADTFVFQTAGVTASTYSTITDLESGDIIQLVDGTTNEFTTTKVSGTASMTFAQWLDAATVAATSDTSDTDAAWFQYNGNTYIMQEIGSNGSTFADNDDVIVEIQGLHDLSTAIFNASTSTLEIA